MIFVFRENEKTVFVSTLGTRRTAGTKLRPPKAGRHSFSRGFFLASGRVADQWNSLPQRQRYQLKNQFSELLKRQSGRQKTVHKPSAERRRRAT
jgi:mRNA-degrading endonuclease RelE of RelBE toxin-antitoxin system